MGSDGGGDPSFVYKTCHVSPRAAFIELCYQKSMLRNRKDDSSSPYDSALTVPAFYEGCGELDIKVCNLIMP